MGLYIIIIFISTVFALSYIQTQKPSALFVLLRRFVAVLFLVLLTVMYIFRNTTVGTDYRMYTGFYYLPISSLKAIGVESAYLRAYQFAQVHSWPLFVTIVSFVIINVGMYLFARRLKLAVPLYLAMYVLSFLYLSGYNSVRQMAAMGVCFIGLGWFVNDDPMMMKQPSFWRHFIMYAVVVAVATQLHASAFIALLLPLCMFLPVRQWMIWVGAIITSFGTLYQLGNVIVPLVTKFFPHYVEKYSTASNEFFTSGSKGLVAFIPVLVQFVLLLMIVRYDRKFADSHRWLTALYFIYLLWFVMAGNQAAVRAQYYWMPAVIYFYGTYIQDGRENIGILSSDIFKIIVIIFFIVYTLLRILTNNSGVYPFLFLGQ